MRQSSLPKICGDTPSFPGSSVVQGDSLTAGYDVYRAVVPWEGTVTWGSFTGCELAPPTIRHAAARYGGFLPESELNLSDDLKLGAMVDKTLNPNDPLATMNNVYANMDRIFKNQEIPFALDGDHSFTPEIIRDLEDNSDGVIGVIHFAAHLDNVNTLGDDEYPRCGPVHRTARLEKVRKKSIIHLGIRGPRNSPAAQYEYAKSMGAWIIA